jgi:hypothetical protein
MLQGAKRRGIKKPATQSRGFFIGFGGQIAALARGGPLRGCVLGNQTRDFVAVFFIGTPRSSELGSATNEKTQAVGPGFGFLVDILERRSNE